MTTVQIRAGLLFSMKIKIRDWSRRYLPAEIVCTITAMAVSYLTFFLTGNYLATAYAGALSEGISYYSYIIINDINQSRKKAASKRQRYTLKHFARNIRNLIVEFGFSEFMDTAFVRPFLMYILPVMLGNVAIGIFLGKIAADIIFYVPTIIAYELRKKHLKD